MRIAEMKLPRKDYWVSLQEQVAAGAEPVPELDYRVLAFSYEDNLIIDWNQTFPGPNPTDLIAGLLMDDQVKNLNLVHGIYHFDTNGLISDKIYHVTINTVRS